MMRILVVTLYWADESSIRERRSQQLLDFHQCPMQDDASGISINDCTLIGAYVENGHLRMSLAICLAWRVCLQRDLHYTGLELVL
jgi:hypothetical protein